MLEANQTGFFWWRGGGGHPPLSKEKSVLKVLTYETKGSCTLDCAMHPHDPTTHLTWTLMNVIIPVWVLTSHIDSFFIVSNCGS